MVGDLMVGYFTYYTTRTFYEFPRPGSSLKPRKNRDSRITAEQCCSICLRYDHWFFCGIKVIIFNESKQTELGPGIKGLIHFFFSMKQFPMEPGF